MKYIAFTLLIILTTACSDDDIVLKESVFISDPAFPGLPTYSEWGYNTFGAYYDRDVFVSGSQEVPLKVTSSEGKTSLLFAGHLNGYPGVGKFHMIIVIPDFAPEEYEDLLTLHQKTLNLKDDGYVLYLERDGEVLATDIIRGTINFKRAQRLLVDNIPQEVILSGTFDISAKIGSKPVAISEGRFDMGVGRTNFFKY